MSQSITGREWSSNCFPEAVKKLLKCYSSSSLYQGEWGTASKFEECCRPKWIKQFVNDYYVNQMSLLRTRYRYRSTITGTFLSLSLSRETHWKLVGNWLYEKERKEQEKKGEMWKKIRFIRHMPEICVAEIKAPARPLRVVHREVPESIHGLTVPWNEIYSNTHTCGLPHWVIS